MYKSKKILAIVPARGGSKGIKDKNLKEIAGNSLISMVGNVISDLFEVDRSITSTDSDRIASEAEKSGLSAPFRRPHQISGDRVGDYEVLLHSLLAIEDIDATEYDVVVMLQPTSPLRNAHIVRQCYMKLIDENLDAVWTVSETDSKNHPLKQLTVDKAGALNYYDPNGVDIVARQQLSKVYHRNGIAYAISRDCLINQKTIFGKRTSAIVVDGLHVSIDTPWYLALVEFILTTNEASG